MNGYINKKALLEFARNHKDGQIDANDIARFPCADVVPKSEYDAVVSAVDNSTKEFLKLHDKYQEQEAEIERLTYLLHCYALQYGTVKDQQAVIDKAKTEVAREIFAEIERTLEAEIICIEGMLFHNTASHDDVIQKKAFEQVLDELAELKKKYTEATDEV